MEATRPHTCAASERDKFADSPNCGTKFPGCRDARSSKLCSDSAGHYRHGVKQFCGLRNVRRSPMAVATTPATDAVRAAAAVAADRRWLRLLLPPPLMQLNLLLCMGLLRKRRC